MTAGGPDRGDRMLAFALAAVAIGAGALALSATRTERSAAAAAQAAPRGAAPNPAADEAWREQAAPPSQVPAGVLARVASRTARGRDDACPPQPARGSAPPRTAPRPPDPAAACGPEPDPYEVEIDWNAASAPR